MRVVGLMSGTSYDGIDAAVADLELGAGPDDVELTLRPRGSLDHPHTAEVLELLQAALPPAAVTMEHVCRLDTLLGQGFASAAARAVEEVAGGSADLVVSHGQTVFHWVEGGHVHGSLQLGQPAWIAERTGVPVVSDLRARDIAKGGQGAPLVGLVDALLLPPSARTRAALNLGGIANATVVRPSGERLAYDLGPANALIDAATRSYFDRPYDEDGRIAASGTVDEKLLSALTDEPYYARTPPKSTGKEMFHAAYLRERLGRVGEPAGADVVATVTELTAWLIARDAHRHGVGELVISGGGARNRHLMRRIADRLGPAVEVGDSDLLGLPADAKEAYAFAVLGYLTMHGLPGILPAATGARDAAVLGTITPGTAPLRLPEAAAEAPSRMRLVDTTPGYPRRASERR